MFVLYYQELSVVTSRNHDHIGRTNPLWLPSGSHLPVHDEIHERHDTNTVGEISPEVTLCYRRFWRRLHSPSPTGSVASWRGVRRCRRSCRESRRSTRKPRRSSKRWGSHTCAKGAPRQEKQKLSFNKLQQLERTNKQNMQIEVTFSYLVHSTHDDFPGTRYLLHPLGFLLKCSRNTRKCNTRNVTLVCLTNAAIAQV